MNNTHVRSYVKHVTCHQVAVKIQYAIKFNVHIIKFFNFTEQTDTTKHADTYVTYPENI